MARFYHLDRVNNITENQIIDLVKYYDINCSDEMFSRELQEHCNLMFPKGVTKHGDQYFVSKNQFTDTDPKIEMLFEYVRRSNFPDRPSRFESFFAVDNIEDIRLLVNTIGRNYPNYNVWEVECENYFKADMNLLHSNSSNLVTSYFAHKYWSGETLGRVKPMWEYLLVPPVEIVKKIEV